jgi:hypothetical protein
VAPFAGGGVMKLGDAALVEAHAPWAPGARLWDGSGLGDCHHCAKRQVNPLPQVRVSGKYLHRERPGR